MTLKSLAIGLVVIGGIGGVAYWQRDTLQKELNGILNPKPVEQKAPAHHSDTGSGMDETKLATPAGAFKKALRKGNLRGSRLLVQEGTVETLDEHTGKKATATEFEVTIEMSGVKGIESRSGIQYEINKEAAAVAKALGGAPRQEAWRYNIFFTWKDVRVGTFHLTEQERADWERSGCDVTDVAGGALQKKMVWSKPFFKDPSQKLD